MKHSLARFGAISFGFALIITALVGHTEPNKPTRFDFLVRDEMFAGFGGDTAALQHAINLCADTLRINPKKAEALVWHGCAIWFLSGQAYRTGNVDQGRALADSGMREMDGALALAPESIGVLIPHGASILAAAPYIPGRYGKVLLKKGIADYEKALQLQKSRMDQLSVHSRGELWGGLANSYRALGDTLKARHYYGELIRQLPGSEYAKRAAKWMALPDLHVKNTTLMTPTCVGCHAQ